MNTPYVNFSKETKGNSLFPDWENANNILLKIINDNKGVFVKINPENSTNIQISFFDEGKALKVSREELEELGFVVSDKGLKHVTVPHYMENVPSKYWLKLDKIFRTWGETVYILAKTPVVEKKYLNHRVSLSTINEITAELERNIHDLKYRGLDVYELLKIMLTE